MFHLLQILILFFLQTYKFCSSLDYYFSLLSAPRPQELLKQLFIQVNMCVYCFFKVFSYFLHVKVLELFT